MTHRQRQTRRHRRRRPPIARRAGLGLAVLGALFALGLLSVTGYVAAVAATAPNLDELRAIDKGQSSVIYAADGSRLGYVQSDEIRTPVRWRQMPEEMRDALVAIEDENFWEHEGVDYGAIVRAGVKNISSGKTVQGGSTITQQLARALYIKDAERSFERKIREAKLASELEQRRSKRWILREYLNSVPFGTINGRTAIGIEAAAQMYFSERAADLKLHQAALIAGLPQAPSQYNPFRNPSAALERRNEVLAAMVRNRHISARRGRSAARKGLDLNRGNRYTKRREPYFFDYVQDQLIERYGAGVFRRGGLKVRTTIDPRLQEAGRSAINSQLGYPDDPSSAVVSIDPKTRPRQGDGLERPVRRAHVQPRRPGSPPARLGLQDDGPGHGDPQGGRPEVDDLPVEAAVAQHQEVRTLEGRDLRQELRRDHGPGPGDAQVRQHGLRAARPRPRSRRGAPHGADDGHHHQARRAALGGPRRPAAGGLAAGDGQRLRHARLRGDAQRARRRSSRSSSPTATPRTSAGPSASASSPTGWRTR